MLLFLWDSISFQMLLIFLTVFLLVADYLKRRKPKNYPPSPLALPFIGHLYLMDMKDPTKAMQKLTEEYGDIFSMHMGSTSFVLVSGQQLIKEVLVNKGEDFIDRPDFPIEQHIFSNKGNPFNPHFQLTNAVSNIICSITFGNRFEYHDEDFQKLLHLLDETVRLHGTIAGQLYPSFPTIMKFLPGSHQTILKNWETMKSFVMERIERHKEDWNPSESRDFIDSYLQEMAKGNSSKSFQEENLVFCVLDLLFAGTETTSTTLRWALLYMALHPEIQVKTRKCWSVSKEGLVQDLENMTYKEHLMELGLFRLDKGEEAKGRLHCSPQPPPRWSEEGAGSSLWFQVTGPKEMVSSCASGYSGWILGNISSLKVFKQSVDLGLGNVIYC
ncbi:cytochrome P450 2J2-like isoform X3 [Melanerpes formicivorus]|uniref:cytochrome P450 2J2-like isoform X3 n=1 Tax=Melanerpes formicivorus TaxID=211600 RepID=UPI00358FC7C7